MHISFLFIYQLLCAWDVDWWTLQGHNLRINDILSDVVFSSTAIPQGRVLSPLLFVLNTNEYKSQHAGRHILKFSDNSVTVSPLDSDELNPGPKSSFLTINMTKTKEMITNKVCYHAIIISNFWVINPTSQVRCLHPPRARVCLRFRHIQILYVLDLYAPVLYVKSWDSFWCELT